MTKKYDFCLMNPPYGKNANLAIAFLNKAAEHSDSIYVVMPRTIRKPVAMNRVNPYLHLVKDVTNPDDTFGGGLTTCWQHWVVKGHKRPKIERYTKDMVSDYFEFTTKDKADIALGRVGSSGHVMIKGAPTKGRTKGFEDRQPSTTYFIKVHDKNVVDELIALEDKFKEAAKETVAVTSLSIDEVVRIYMENYCEFRFDNR